MHSSNIIVIIVNCYIKRVISLPFINCFVQLKTLFLNSSAFSFIFYFYPQFIIFPRIWHCEQLWTRIVAEVIIGASRFYYSAMQMAVAENRCSQTIFSIFFQYIIQIFHRFNSSFGGRGGGARDSSTLANTRLTLLSSAWLVINYAT